MRRGGAAVCCGAGAWLLAATALAAPGDHAFEVDGDFGGAVLFRSELRESLRAFGQYGPVAGLQFAVRALWGRPRARMGFRVGYLATSASAGDVGLGASSPSDVWFYLVDAGWALRVIAWRGSEPVDHAGRLGFDLEVGGAIAVTTWARGTDARLLPRLGVSTVVAFASATPLHFGLRVGVQYIPSGGVGGESFWDPAFAGVTLGLELGGGR